MNKSLKITVFALLALFLSVSVNAQKLKSGKIVYEMSYDNLPPELEAFKGMLPKESITYYNGKMSRVDVSLGVGESRTIQNLETKEVTTVMDLMGKKVAMKSNPETAEEETADEEVKTELVLSDETKEINGFPCKKATLKMGDEEVEIWYSKKLKVKGLAPTNLPEEAQALKGFPIQYTVKQGGMTVTMTVKEVVKETYKPEKFEVPAGYDIVTEEEFAEMFQGMGF